MRIPAAVAGLFLLAAVPVPAQTSRGHNAVEARRAVFIVSDQALAGALARIDNGSASWRAALDSVAARGGRIVITTVREVAGVPEQFARTELAAVSPVVAADSSVRTVLVVVNRELIDRLYALAHGTRAERDADLMRILVHEVYGHAVPYLLAGHVRGACPDPVGSAVTGCSVARENVVRSELALQKRRGHDLSGLALSRYIDP